MTLTQITKVKGPGIHTLANIVSNTISLGGIATASNFKTGTSNLHNVGLEIAGINVLGADTPIGTGATIYDAGGAVFTGVVTATSFSGSIAGTADLASGLTGTPDIAVRNITGVGATFTGNVSIGGTLTYEDVTNIDSIGIITARDGLKVLGGGANIVGVTTSTGGFVGALTGTASGNPTLTNGSNNRVITASSASAIQGETNLTYDGTNMLINGTMLNAVQLKFGNSGTAYIDHNIVGQDLQFRVGNSSALDKTALHIDSTGKVGINETSPDRDLHISNTTPYIRVESTSANQPATLELYHTRGNGSDKWPVSVATDDAALTFNVATAANGSPAEKVRILSDGKIGIGTENPSVRLHVSDGSIRSSNTAGTNFTELGSDGNIELKRTGGSAYIDFADATGNDADCRIQHVTDGFEFSTGGQGSRTTKLVIDSSGHITPGAAGTQDLGSTAKEFRNLYIGNSGRVYLGDAQEVSLYHNGSNSYLHGGANAGLVQIKNEGGNIDLMSWNNVILRVNAGENAVVCNLNSSVDLYFDGGSYTTPKLKTSHTGVIIDGEVAASQDYPDFRPTLDFNFAQVKKLDPRITYTRTGPASYTDEFGKVVLVGDNTPRFDHDLETRESKGLLIEESRTNFMKYSDEFAIDHGQTGGNWDAIGGESQWTRVSDTTETKDPAGTYHASKLTKNSGNVLRGYWYSGAADGAVSKTFSVYLKRATSNATTVTIDIGDTSSTAMTLTDEWKRYSVTTSTAGNGNFVDLTGTASRAFYAWGCQIEAGAFATSYIPTSTAAVTRGADLALIDGEEFTDFFNQDEGTINCAYWLGNDNIGLRIFQINDSNNSVIDIVAGSGSGAGGYGYVNTGGTAQANGGSSSTNANNLNTLHVTTLAYKENDVAGINIKNGTLTNDTSATLDGAYNRVTFYQGANGADQLNGHFQRVQYYPKRLPDNQLKNLNNQ